MSEYAYKSGYGSTDQKGDIRSCAQKVSAGKYQTLDRLLGASLQVTAGKQYTITEVIFSGSAAGTYFQIGYGDDEIDDSAVPPTNGLFFNERMHAKNADETYTVKVCYKVPALKYPFIFAGTGSAYIVALGIEE